jgi:hypothetical protein
MWCGVRVVVPIFGTLLAALGSSGCARNIVRLYEGPERPGSQIAILFHWDGVRVESVDGRDDVDAPQVHLLPGCRLVSVRFDRLVRSKEEPTPQAMQRARVRSAGNAEAYDRVNDSSSRRTGAGVVHRYGGVGGAAYSMNAWFAVELKAAHFYEVASTFNGDDFAPRLIEYAPSGERLFAYSAAHWSARDCAESSSERQAAGG